MCKINIVHYALSVIAPAMVGMSIGIKGKNKEFVKTLQKIFICHIRNSLFLPLDSNTHPNYRRRNQNHTLHKQSESQYPCVTVFFFFFFLHFLKAIFFAKIEVNNHHHANQYHQHKSCLRRYPTHPVSECEIYQTRLEQKRMKMCLIFKA